MRLPLFFNHMQYTIIAIIMGILITYCIICRRKAKRTQQLDEEALAQNKFIHQCNKELTITNAELREKKSTLAAQVDDLQEQLITLHSALANNAVQEKEKYDKAIEECHNAYLNISADCAESTRLLIQQLQTEEQQVREQLEKVTLELQQEEDNVRLAQANARRQEEMESQLQFYTINITTEAMTDIGNLRAIIPQFKDPLPFNKAIWECYFRVPTGQMIERVVGAKDKCGIYKITNLQNGRCYIGQSVNSADRFKAHIRAGLGIDATRNKLYTTMQSVGIENFSFEVIEECSREQLNEREKFWIAYYQSDTVGLNSTKGNN